MSVWAATTSSLLLAAWLHYSLTDDYRFIKEPQEIYDYIIVGAGTSGCVLAAKLAAAEDGPSSGKVLVIEAGGEPPWYSWIPLIAPVLQGSTKHDWRFQTVPQKFAAGALHNNVINKLLTIINYYDRTRFNSILSSNLMYIIAILLASRENGNFHYLFIIFDLIKI